MDFRVGDAVVVGGKHGSVTKISKTDLGPIVRVLHDNGDQEWYPAEAVKDPLHDDENQR